MRLDGKELPDAHLSYRPFAELRYVCDGPAQCMCDNAPDEKGIRWNQLMYW